jgi:hypothetical protein
VTRCLRGTETERKKIKSPLESVMFLTFSIELNFRMGDLKKSYLDKLGVVFGH